MDHRAEKPDEGAFDDALALSIASRCFWHVDEQEWRQITEHDNWDAFLDALARMGADRDARYMQALQDPPGWEGFRRACRHFVGGLPASAVPVESLYATPDQMVSRDESGGGSFWMQKPALYMAQLVARLGMAVPDEFRDCPDHLALELDMASSLVAAGAAEQAADFVPARLAWLPRYRGHIASLAEPGADAPVDLAFHAALVDALVDVAGAWGKGAGQEQSP